MVYHSLVRTRVLPELPPRARSCELWGFDLDVNRRAWREVFDLPVDLSRNREMDRNVATLEVVGVELPAEAQEGA